MLEHLLLRDVGPASRLELDLAPRLNLLTGDNGLGKTFLLDIAWWCLTRTWACLSAWPHAGTGKRPFIQYSLLRREGEATVHASEYSFSEQVWKRMAATPRRPFELVLYVRADGGFSLWDPARNSHNLPGKHARPGDSERPSAFHFDRRAIWNGLEDGGHILCNGLIRDWVTWQYQGSSVFQLIRDALVGLSPHPAEVLRPGKPIRVSVADARDIPTLELPYGIVPVTHASAGMRRVLALTYLMIWAWHEHCAAVELLGSTPTRRFVLLIDEMEAHLHPQWQRVLLPAIVRVIKRLNRELDVQVLASTHAPLVMASVEADFQEDLDKIFTFEERDGKVEVSEVPWAKQGDAVGWLTSEAFGLRQARSSQAEQAIEAAEAFMRGDLQALPGDLKTREAIHDELSRVLPGHDPFWPRWVVTAERRSA